MDVDFFKKNSYDISRLITKHYSTSFSIATSLIEREKRKAIYAIYGFVRLADEIVDSFNGYDKEFLLGSLQKDLDYVLETGICTNPILVAFADTVHKYSISKKHINSFMESMRNDLKKSQYKTKKEIDQYIYGSADVVGLMCLKVFCNGNEILYKNLNQEAQSLGSAFQKVNFLRDLNFDINALGRIYFPELNNAEFNEETKKVIEESIDKDFVQAYYGINQLPGKSKLAVLVAYHYYKELFKKIKRTPPKQLMSVRIRISNTRKYFLILKVYLIYILSVYKFLLR